MGEVKEIEVSDKDLELLRVILSKYLSGKKVWSYGSRINGNFSKSSDLDCIAFNATEAEIGNAIEAFENSDLPFEVQLLRWEDIPDSFRQNIKMRYFMLQQ